MEKSEIAYVFLMIVCFFVGGYFIFSTSYYYCAPLEMHPKHEPKPERVLLYEDSVKPLCSKPEKELHLEDNSDDIGEGFVPMKGSLDSCLNTCTADSQCSSVQVDRLSLGLTRRPLKYGHCKLSRKKGEFNYNGHTPFRGDPTPSYSSIGPHGVIYTKQDQAKGDVYTSPGMRDYHIIGSKGIHPINWNLENYLYMNYYKHGHNIPRYMV